MDKVIVTALLVIAGVTAAALVVTTLTPIVGKSSRSVVESQKDMSLRIQTDITVIQVHSNTATTTKAWVKSVGNSNCLLYTSPSPRDRQKSRMPSSA